MKFWIDKFVEDVKYLISKKMELMASREDLKTSLTNGHAFFASADRSRSELEAGAARMRELVSEFQELDRAILDLDTIIVSNFEMYMGNFIAKAKMPDRLNEAGDLIKHNEVFAVPFHVDEKDKKEITPEEIWFLKMIKEAYKATNITFIEK